jgi:type II secretory pathway pseudopilin PulG
MKQAHSGSTMIELMVVVVITFIATASFISSLTIASRVQTRTVAQSRVLEQVQRTIEQIQNSNFSTLQTTWDDTGFDVSGVNPPTGVAQVGAVDIFSSTSTKVPFRITATWEDLQGPCAFSVVYVHTNRGG